MNLDFLTKTYGEIETRYEETNGEGVDIIGVPTGFSELDEDTGGLRNDSVTLIAARTGLGKSAFAMSIMMMQIARGIPVVYHSLEMSEPMMVLRMLSMLTGIPALIIERGRLKKRENLEAIKTAMEWLKDKPLDIIDKGLTSAELTDYYGNNYPKARVYYVDHMGILRDPISNLYEKMSLVADNVRAVARDLDKPVISVAQLNRAVDNREGHIPSNADLRDSGKIEENAETIWMPFRPNYYIEAGMDDGERVKEGQAERNAKIFMTKNRYGPSGQGYSVWFYPHSALWTDQTEPVRLPKAVIQPAARTPIPRSFTSGNLANLVREGR